MIRIHDELANKQSSKFNDYQKSKQNNKIDTHTHTDKAMIIAISIIEIPKKKKELS